jgi:hypothetical protein
MSQRKLIAPPGTHPFPLPQSPPLHPASSPSPDPPPPSPPPLADHCPFPPLS